MLEELPDVATVPQVAKALGVGVNQLYAAVRRGDVYAARLGRRILIPKPALVRWLMGEDQQRRRSA
jgi:excisionase family DNA binding protein